MCTPKQTAQIGLGLDLSSTVGGAFSAASGASVERRIAQNNARFAEMQAEDAVMRGGREEAGLRRKAAKLTGRQRAVLGAGNIDPSQGSALDILEETARQTELDAQVIRTNAGREAARHRFEAAGYRGRAAGSRPGLAAATSLLTNAPRVASRWYDYQKTYG